MGRRKDKNAGTATIGKRRAFNCATIGKLSVCACVFASTSPYALDRAERPSAHFGNQALASSPDVEPIQNQNQQSENPTRFHAFDDDARQWKIDLLSGVVYLSDDSNLKEKEVYRANASLENSIHPVFKDVKEDAFYNRVYITTFERNPGPIDDVATPTPTYRLKTLAFDPIAQGKTIWSFVPELATPRSYKEKLRRILSQSVPLSTKTSLVANPDSDVLTLKLFSSTDDSFFEWSIDASSGTTLFFQSF